MLQFTLGQLQIIGSVLGLIFLLAYGVSTLAVTTILVTGLITLMSRRLFRPDT